jgi:nitroreductase
MYEHPRFDLFEAIYTTRSMRRLKPDPVATEVVMKIIEAATMGPSGGNRQPWRWVVVTANETKNLIAERYLSAWERYLTAGARAILENEPESPQGRILKSARYLATHIAEVPVLVFVCVRRYTDPSRRGQPQLGAIYPAIQNLCLAARAYGLGTCITTMYRVFAHEIDAHLGIPPEYENVALIPIGYPKGRWGRPDRRPVAEVTYWERWGETRKV